MNHDLVLLHDWSVAVDRKIDANATLALFPSQVTSELLLLTLALTQWHERLRTIMDSF